MPRGVGSLVVIVTVMVLMVLMMMVTQEPPPFQDPPSTTTPLHHHPHHRHRRKSPVHPHTHLTTPELIAIRGYPAEVHTVITPDGYIIELHRIPHGRTVPYAHAHTSPHAYESSHAYASPYAPPHAYTAPYKRHVEGQISTILRNITTGDSSSRSSSRRRRSGRRVAFLLHGILESSADYVMNDPDQALGFLLADAGYDVWLGNHRGNVYGRRHVRLSPSDPKFWDYNWNEMARYDLPAMLGYVRQATGAGQIFYAGHSLGCALLFAMFHYHPHLNPWVRVMAAMAPSNYIYHKRGPIGLLSPFIDKIDKFLTKVGVLELFMANPDISSTVSKVCGARSITNFLCIFIYFFIGGANSNYLDREYVPVIFSHTPAGTGLHVLTHLLQLHKARRFQAFDYGKARNLVEYGSPIPPLFLLSRVRVPVGLFFSDNDWVVDPLDVKQTASELPNVALLYRVPLRDFNHLDFSWAENANVLVYRPIIELFSQF